MKVKSSVAIVPTKNHACKEHVRAFGKNFAPNIADTPTARKHMKNRIVFSISRTLKLFIIAPKTVNVTIAHTKLFVTIIISGADALQAIFAFILFNKTITMNQLKTRLFQIKPLLIITAYLEELLHGKEIQINYKFLQNETIFEDLFSTIF